MNLRMTGLAAFAAAMLLLVGGKSEASFSYSATQSPSSVTSGGSTLTLTGLTGGPGLSGATIINADSVALTSTTAPPATDKFSLTFTDTVTITPSAGAAVVLKVNQTLDFFRSDKGGEVSTDTLNGGSSILTGSNSHFSYTIAALQYAGPTVNGGAGTISYIITETSVVPEPASLGMVALGLGFAGFVGFRRRRAA